MMNLFGWAVLGIDLCEADERSEIAELSTNILKFADELNLLRAVEISPAGGSTILRMALVQNRDRGDTERCLDLLGRLGDLGPASYGVIYKRDDDTSDSLQRIVLRRGQVEVLPDDLFSPIVPMIEDPE